MNSNQENLPLSSLALVTSLFFIYQFSSLSIFPFSLPLFFGSFLPLVLLLYFNLSL